MDVILHVNESRNIGRKIFQKLPTSALVVSDKLYLGVYESSKREIAYNDVSWNVGIIQ